MDEYCRNWLSHLRPSTGRTTTVEISRSFSRNATIRAFPSPVVVSRHIQCVFGLNVPMNTIPLLCHNNRASQYPFSRILQSTYAKRKREKPYTYIWSVPDELDNEKDRTHVDQVGVSIVLSNHRRLPYACISPRLAFDGTFGVMASYDGSLDFELDIIVVKYEENGRIFSVMR